LGEFADSHARMSLRDPSGCGAKTLRAGMAGPPPARPRGERAVAAEQCLRQGFSGLSRKTRWDIARSFRGGI